MYNILMDRWVPVLRKDGRREEICPWEITKGGKKNPVIEAMTPRGDLRSGLFHFLLGILQVMLLPEDDDAWYDLWEAPPKAERLREIFTADAESFHLYNPGRPAFMQDLELKEGNDYFSNLFIDFSANEHFQKQAYQAVDPYWAGLGVFTMQQFAPAGGAGHRTGLRGGGPLSTFIIPGHESTLWEKLWMNVLPAAEIRSMTGNARLKGREHIFPWLKPTKVSKKATDGFYPQEAHPLMMYFGMPRRFRLGFSGAGGTCELSGKQSENLVTSLITKNHGNNYSGPWQHPLSPYYQPQKEDDPPNSFKGKAANIQYRHWLGLSAKDNKISAAKVVVYVLREPERKELLAEKGALLWLNGYDMNNMKAVNWSDRMMPAFVFPEQVKESLLKRIGALLEAAGGVADNTRFYILKAMFKEAIKGDWNEIRVNFFLATENRFFDTLRCFHRDCGEVAKLNEAMRSWRNHLVKSSNGLFERYIIQGDPGELAWPRIHAARKKLTSANSKVLASLENYYTD